MDARSLKTNPDDYKLSRLLLSRIWRLVRPYWFAKGNWTPRVVLLLLILLTPAMPALTLWFATFIRELTNAMVAKQEARHMALLWQALGVGGLSMLVLCASLYLSTWLNVNWRQWLTDYMVTRYLDKKTYYDIALREDLDNPDQRIQEQIGPFLEQVSAVPQRLLSQTMQLVTGGIIISTISPTMTWFVIGFALFQTVATFIFYTPLIRLNFDNTVAEADLRYGILHVRENAETIAFYRGEPSEHRQIWERLLQVTRTKMALLLYQVKLGAGMNGLQTLWQLAPFVLLAPLFFEGKLDVGAIGMATTAAGSMLAALTTLSDYIPRLTETAPGAVRLAQILERFDEMDAERASGEASTVTVSHAPRVAMHDVNLETPGGEQKLVRDLDFSLRSGEHLVVVGQTGVGKSSLLRAMAGLWQRGTGAITMPPIEQTMFLPQRPYMILSDLRSQLLYPRRRDDMPDDELQHVLERVLLPDLLEKHGGLDAVRDWAKVLSLGEQQRIGFARVLISRARYVFLDEATSAVDTATEAVLYGLLQEEGVTYVSVGHRETILHFHDRALCLLPGGGYRLVCASELIAAEGPETGLVEPEPEPASAPGKQVV